MKTQFHRKVLKNGMTLIFEKRNLPVVSVAFAVRSGGVNEKISEKGISHFIEHMIYKGTPTRDARQIASELEKNGAEINGFTTETLTAFWCKIPSKHLDIALDVLSDIIKNSLFDEKELEKERKVILEEIKKRKDTPILYLLDHIQAELYTGTLGMDSAGNYKILKTIDRKKIFDRFKQIYTPNNLILGIVGNADFNEIVKFAEKNFSNIKGKNPKIKFLIKNGEKIEKRKGIEQANLIFAYHVPLSTNKKSYAAEVLNTLMATGMSSRLFHEIREKRNLAYAIEGDSEICKVFAYNFIYVGTKKENVGIVKKMILDEFKKVSEELTETELNQIKEQLIGNYHINMEDSHSQLLNLLLYEIDGDARDFYEYEKDIKAVKLKDVKELAKIKKYSFLALVPE